MGEVGLGFADMEGVVAGVVGVRAGVVYFGDGFGIGGRHGCGSGPVVVVVVGSDVQMRTSV